MDDRLLVSTIDWWQEAGLDTFVEESPRDWLAQAMPAPVAAPSVAAAPALPAALPADLAAFRRFLLEDAAIPGPPASRLDAAGDPAAGAMIVVDMAEAEDRAARRLLSGEVGGLFDNMLRAIGLTRETVYLVPLSPARPASGRLAPAIVDALAPLIRHHVALAAPKRLLLFGDAPARALTGFNCLEARGRMHPVSTLAGDIPAIVSFHPRLLHQTPARKKAAWDDLKLFMAL